MYPIAVPAIEKHFAHYYVEYKYIYIEMSFRVFKKPPLSAKPSIEQYVYM